MTFQQEKASIILRDEQGQAVGAIIREWKALKGSVEIRSLSSHDEVVRITVQVENLTSNSTPASDTLRESILLDSLVSAHTILGVDNGEFLSLLEPPPGFEDQAAQCQNLGTWPVLATDNADAVLSSPIILYDHPQIAPESAGNLFDSTEIDEILSLRILTLTDEEKREMRQSDDRTRAILERTEKMPEEQFAKLHGILRGLTPVKRGDPMNEWEWNLLEDKTGNLDHVEIEGIAVKVGDRVRLRPKEGGDILDIALRGQIAIIESIEEDYEGAQHICVVIEDDPGRDLGMMRQPGHRFFFTPAEVEPLPLSTQAPESETAVKAFKAKILVAGIGNIFLGDDAFGVEVVRRLMNRNQLSEARIVDFGIRGLDLAYALQDGYETTILIDAFPHGQMPGTVSFVEPDLERNHCRARQPRRSTQHASPERAAHGCRNEWTLESGAACRLRAGVARRRRRIHGPQQTC